MITDQQVDEFINDTKSLAEKLSEYAKKWKSVNAPDRDLTSEQKAKLGHAIIDLGVALEGL